MPKGSKKRTHSGPEPPSKKRKTEDLEKFKKRKTEDLEKLRKEMPKGIFEMAAKIAKTMREDSKQFDLFLPFLKKVCKVIPTRLKPKSREKEKKEVRKFPYPKKKKPISMVEDVIFQKPRGKFQLEIFSNCLAFRNQTRVNKDEKTDAHVIDWSNLQYFITVDEKDRKSNFCLVLKKPIQVGKQIVEIVLFEFEFGEEIELDLVRKIGDVSRNCKDVASNTIGKIIEHLSKVPLFRSNPELFETKDKSSFIKCSLGSNFVRVFPLPKGLMILTKPLMYIPLDDIDTINTSGQRGARYMDIELKIISGEKKIEFGMVPKEDIEPFEKYVRTQKLPAGDEDEDTENENAVDDFNLNAYNSESDDEFDFEAALTKVDVSRDFSDGKSDMLGLASDGWKQLLEKNNEVRKNGDWKEIRDKQGAVQEDEDSSEDSNFEFDAELKKTDMRKDFDGFSKMCSKEVFF